jgi:hypothetical protein
MTHIHTRPTRFLIASLALLTAAGCFDSTGPGHVEEPGVLLVAARDSGFWSEDLVWTKDGTEVVFVSPTVTTAAPRTSANLLNAVSISTHEVRQLNESQSIFSVARGSAGERIYFAADAGLNDGNFRVNRVQPASSVVEILASIPLDIHNDILVSADERFLAVGSGLYDLQTAGRINLPAGRPIGFSPDGTQLLYELFNVTGSTELTTLISTADGSSHPLHSTGSSFRHLAHRWEGNSPQLLVEDWEYTGQNSDTVRLSEIDGVSGVSRSIAEFTTTSPFVTAAWSPNGQTLGVWIDLGSVRERTDRTSLFLIRDGTEPAYVASVHGSPGPPVFSPDGHSVVYYYNYSNDTRSVYIRSGI